MSPKCPECGSDNAAAQMSVCHESTDDGRLFAYVPMRCRDCGKVFAPHKIEIDREEYEKTGRTRRAEAA